MHLSIPEGIANTRIGTARGGSSGLAARRNDATGDDGVAFLAAQHMLRVDGGRLDVELNRKSVSLGVFATVHSAAVFRESERQQMVPCLQFCLVRSGEVFSCYQLADLSQAVDDRVGIVGGALGPGFPVAVKGGLAAQVDGFVGQTLVLKFGACASVGIYRRRGPQGNREKGGVGRHSNVNTLLLQLR